MLLTSLREFFLQEKCQAKIWLAYSGGMDSHVLLSLCHELAHEFSLSLCAVHLHHGWSVYADAWACHCQHVCDDLGIDFHKIDLNLSMQAGESSEALARDARYTVFASLMNEGDYLLTAHHQDDQLETILTQLCRGAGPKGLSGMPVLKKLGKGVHARPLLDFSRKDLHDYAKQQDLCWIEDDSNTNTQFTRNFFRHNVIPLLRERWPGIEKIVARSARHCAETEGLLNTYLEHDLQLAMGIAANQINLDYLLTQPIALQRALLRKWIASLGYVLPNQQKLNEIIYCVLLASGDKQPCVTWSNVILRRYRNQLYLLNQQDLVEPPQQDFNWALSTRLNLPNLGSLQALKTQGHGLSSAITHLSVRFRVKGEWVSMHNRGRRSLKKLLQALGVPPWERAHIPLLFLNDIFVGAVGYYLDPAFCAKQDEWGYEVVYVK